MKAELLAPAGSFAKLKTALYFGADAAYVRFEGALTDIDASNNWALLPKRNILFCAYLQAAFTSQFITARQIGGVPPLSARNLPGW